MSKNDDLVRRLRKWAGDNPLTGDETLMAEAADAIERGAAQGEASKSVGSIVPSGCSGTSLAFSEGVLHVAKDGSGYIAIGEDEFTLEDDRCEGPDGPEGSVHWITRFPPGEMEALRDFLNGLHLSTPPAPTPQPPAVEAEARTEKVWVQNLRGFLLQGIPFRDEWKAIWVREVDSLIRDIKAKTDEIERLQQQLDEARSLHNHQVRRAEAAEAIIDAQQYPDVVRRTANLLYEKDAKIAAAEASKKALREKVEKVIEDMPESYYRTQLAAALRALRGEGGMDG